MDGQINLRAVAFGNNFDVQDMGWRWMMGECYEGLMRDVADENGDRFEYAGAESMDGLMINMFLGMLVIPYIR